MYNDLSINLKAVEAKIHAACQRANRNTSEVTLIAVSKTKPIEMISAVYNDGVRNFGENKVQEIQKKLPELPNDIHWHMIGHLQRNKVSQVIDKACLIHSVDSLRLAEQIEKDAAKADIIVPILLEVNVANEESKYGFKTEEVETVISDYISKFQHIAVKGLMTIAPNVENPEENRLVFRKLKQLSVDIKNKNIDNISMEILSMGMTNDYEVAIEEGSTMIRVGTGIFGARHYE